MGAYQVLIFVSLYVSVTSFTNGLHDQQQPSPSSAKWAFAQSYSWVLSGNNPLGQQTQAQIQQMPQQQEQQRQQADERNRQAQIQQEIEKQAMQEQQMRQAQLRLSMEQQALQNELNRQAQARHATHQQAIQDERNRQAQIRQTMDQQVLQEKQMRQAQIRLATEQQALQEQLARQAQIRQAIEQQAMQEERNRQARIRQAMEQQALQEQQMRQAQIRLATEQQALQEQLERQAQIRQATEQQARQEEPNLQAQIRPSAVREREPHKERELQQIPMEQSTLRQRALQRYERQQQPNEEREEDALQAIDFIEPNESNRRDPKTGTFGNNWSPSQNNEFPQKITDEIVRKVIEETRGELSLPIRSEDIEKIVRKTLHGTAYKVSEPNSYSNGLNRQTFNDYEGISNANPNIGWHNNDDNLGREGLSPRKTTAKSIEKFNPDTECIFNCGNSQSNGQPIAVAMAMANSFYPLNTLTDPRIGGFSFTYTSV